MTSVLHNGITEELNRLDAIVDNVSAFGFQIRTVYQVIQSVRLEYFSIISSTEEERRSIVNIGYCREGCLDLHSH